MCQRRSERPLHAGYAARSGDDAVGVATSAGVVKVLRRGGGLLGVGSEVVEGVHCSVVLSYRLTGV